MGFGYGMDHRGVWGFLLPTNVIGSAWRTFSEIGESLSPFVTRSWLLALISFVTPNHTGQAGVPEAKAAVSDTMWKALFRRGLLGWILGDARPSIEPWLRGTESDVLAVARAVLHALQLAEEDLLRWCGDLSDDEVTARPFDVASVAFHIRHVARRVDRLLTYAEGRSLCERQLAQFRTELDPGAKRAELFAELSAALSDAAARVRVLARTNLEETRTVGKKGLPTTVGGLLVHIADHTQRHVGQAITTAKIVAGMREEKESRV